MEPRLGEQQFLFLLQVGKQLQQAWSLEQLLSKLFQERELSLFTTHRFVLYFRHGMPYSISMNAFAQADRSSPSFSCSFSI